ncbi:MAG TPA: helix-hairpin-helix domain-containing protein [candidate division Zixibacteria bacterium]|nr:helix-hairpin-helix domain-containing protein [candidate division Zixibacteria bacterium]
MSLGMKAWLIPGALIALALAGVWMFIHRRVDPWITMGVIGILFRFSIYHRWYDDLLILPALVALYRIAKQGMATGNRDVLAGLLFIFMLIMMMAPGGLYLLPPPWNGYVTQIQVVVWTGTLLFLLHQAWQEREPAIRAVSVDAIEAASGLNLFASQPDNLEDRLEGTASLQEWPAVFSRGGPRSGSGSSAPRSVPVNVNTASQSQLESLPGIGPVIARRIITGRPWCRVKALTDVKGIGKKRLAGIRGLATVL